MVYSAGIMAIAQDNQPSVGSEKKKKKMTFQL